jgi:hypothetical protein
LALLQGKNFFAPVHPQQGSFQNRRLEIIWTLTRTGMLDAEGFSNAPGKENRHER